MQEKRKSPVKNSDSLLVRRDHQGLSPTFSHYFQILALLFHRILQRDFDPYMWLRWLEETERKKSVKTRIPEQEEADWEHLHGVDSEWNPNFQYYSRKYDSMVAGEVSMDGWMFFGVLSQRPRSLPIIFSQTLRKDPNNQRHACAE